MYGEFLNISPSFRREFFRTAGADPQTYFLYLQEGSFSLKIKEELRILTPGSLVFFSPNTEMERHVLEPIRFLYIGCNMNSSVDFFRETRVFSELPPRGREDLLQLEGLTKTRGTGGLEWKSHYFKDLLLVLHPPKREGGGAEPHFPSSLTRAITFMEENLREKLSVGQIAAHCSLSPTSLEVLFRTYLETSVYDYFISLRMEKAMGQLSDTPYSVGQIAYHCGFDNPFYFCNAFKKRFGMTPSQYRKSNRV